MPENSPTSIPGLDLKSAGNECSPSPVSSPTSMLGPDTQRPGDECSPSPCSSPNSMLGPDTQSFGDESSPSYTPQGNALTSPGPDCAAEDSPCSTPQIERKRKLSSVSESSGRSNKDQKIDSWADSTVISLNLEEVPSNPGIKSSPPATRAGSLVISLEDIPPDLGKKSPSPSTKDLETTPRPTESGKHLGLDSFPCARTSDSLPSPVMSGLSESSESLEHDEEAAATPEDDHSSICEDVPLPKAPVYNLSLQRGLGDVRKQLSRLTDMIDLSDLMIDQGSILNELRPEAEELSKFTYPETRTVGFIGTSGEGKSSVINSLLDKINLSKASGSGSACTSVVTEFRYVDDSHPGPYTIEALFMNLTEITELLEELLRSFRVYCTHSSFSELSSSDKQETLRDAASRAEETLESLFNSQPGWNREFLTDDTEGAEVVILAKLREWAQIAVSLRPGGHNSLVYTTTVKNVQQCTEKFNYLVADSHEDGRPALWPFIRLLRVYLKSPVLRPGLVVADLPGFRDMNYARVRATERYLSGNCDEVFIASNIARCLSDQTIPDIMRRCANKPWHIVCTKSDAIYYEEEARDKSPYAVKLRKTALKLKKDNTQLSKLRTKARGTSFGLEGSSEVVELIDRIEGLEMKQTRLMIDRRNDRVKGTLKKRYPGIGVFCVSNTLYATHRASEHRLANDYIALSEIRELREHCQLVPAAAQLRMIEAYLNHRVPALLGSLRQWALAGADSVTGERAAALRTAISQVDATIQKEIVSPHGCVERTRRELTDLFEANILQLIGQSEIAWTEKCVKLSEKWATWAHGTYGAFCRHNGTWKSGSVGYHSWNEDLIKQAQRQLGPEFGSIRQWLEFQLVSLTNTASTVFKRVLALLRLYEPHAPQAIKNLFSCMERRKQNINFAIETHLNRMIQNTDSLSRQMINGHDSSMMADLMRPAYLKCTIYTGKGSDKMRKGAFNDHLKNSRLFIQYHALAKAAYAAVVDENFKALLEILLDEVRKITRDLSMVVAAEGEVHEAEQKTSLAQEMKVGIENAQEFLDRAIFDLQSAKKRG